MPAKKKKKEVPEALLIAYESMDEVLVTTPALEEEFLKHFGFVEDPNAKDPEDTKCRWTGEEYDDLYDEDEEAAEKINHRDVYDRIEIYDPGAEVSMTANLNVW